MGRKFDVNRDVQFDLYTLRNPTKPQILKINDANSIDKSNFNRDLPTRIFIHGWQGIKIFAKVLTTGKKNRMKIILIIKRIVPNNL